MGGFYAYSPYGEVAVLGPDGGNDLQYAGLRNDGTGLYQAVNRYYDPILKQWISEDPIGLAGGVNQYAYVGGAPLAYADPRGLYNPVKGAVAVANAARGGYQLVTGVVGIAIGVSTGNTVAAALGLWRYKAGLSSLFRAAQQGREAACEPLSAASWRNLKGLLPFGQFIDDPSEPGAWEFYKSLPRERIEHWTDIVTEFGTLF